MLAGELVKIIHCTCVLSVMCLLILSVVCARMTQAVSSNGECVGCSTMHGRIKATFTRALALLPMLNPGYLK